MANVVAYHRPSSVDGALRLLSRSGVSSRVLAGGTDLVGAGGHAEPFEAVDLQDTGLGGISVGESRAMLGATVTLEQLSRHADLPYAVRDAARREEGAARANRPCLRETVRPRLRTSTARYLQSRSLHRCVLALA